MTCPGPRSMVRISRVLRALLVPVLVLLLTLHGAPAQAASAGVVPWSGTDTAAAEGVVVEHLRLRVPAQEREAWLEAERQSWEPWLAAQPGFLDRQLFWDPASEEGTLLIRWVDRSHWKAIPPEEVAAVQRRFEDLARRATGQDGNPFPLVFEGELQPA